MEQYLNQMPIYKAAFFTIYGTFLTKRNFQFFKHISIKINSIDILKIKFLKQGMQKSYQL